jgi:hypothetical protein
MIVGKVVEGVLEIVFMTALKFMNLRSPDHEPLANTKQDPILALRCRLIKISEYLVGDGHQVCPVHRTDQGIGETVIDPVKGIDTPGIVKSEGRIFRAVRGADIYGQPVAGGVFIHKLGDRQGFFR